MENDVKKIKASSWALGILFVLSAIVLVLFFAVGFGDTLPIGGKNLTAPRYTDLLLIWIYVMVAICAGCVLVFGIANGIRNMKTKTAGTKRTGFAGIIFLLTAVIVVVSYFMASTKAVRLGDDSLVDTVWELKITDVCLYSIYALVLISILCSILSMLGVFKSKR